MESKITISEVSVGMRVYYITLIFTLLSILFGCETNEDHWDNFRDKSKSLGYEVLSIEASETWIKEHSDEISLPNKIKFGKPHHLQDFGFAPYGIMIAVDTNNRYRVIATEWPEEKTLLKVGDMLLPFPPFIFSRKTFDGTTEESSPFDWKTEIETYVFEAKETIVQPYLEEVAETKVRIEPSRYQVVDLYDFKCTTYTSPKGATISYKISDQTDHRNRFGSGFIVTKIDGTVFKRHHNLSPWRETAQEDIVVPRNGTTFHDIDVSIMDHEWNDFIARKKLLGCEVLSAAASKAWIEKYTDKISYPIIPAGIDMRPSGFDIRRSAFYGRYIDKISYPIPNPMIFGKPHSIQDFGFAPYGIMIALDSDNNRRVIARKWPEEKTLLKVGDTLTTTFVSFSDPVEISEFFDGSDILNKTRNFVFQAEETIFHRGIPVPKLPSRFKEEAVDYMGFDTYTLYMSPKGATITYNVWGVVTKIEGTVFQRVVDLTEIATSLLE